MKLGFIGLGSMGEPMALNLLKAGFDLTVWNRSPSKLDMFKDKGATIAQDVSHLFQTTDVVILMLANASAIDEVLMRGHASFAQMIKGKVLINMGTNPPRYSQLLEADVVKAGGIFIEAPVSGSRKPAELGQLITMVAGDSETVNSVKSVLQAMSQQVVDCGAVPNALMTKLAVNIFLITSVTGLAEALNFAKEKNLNLESFIAILNSSQMASSISKIKTEKFISNDFTKQAGVTDVLANTQLIYDASHEGNIHTPLIDECLKLYTTTQRLGRGQEDMISVVHGFSHFDLKSFIESWLRSWTGNRPQELRAFYSQNAFYRDPFHREGIQGEALLPYFQKLLARNPNWVWTVQEIFPIEKGTCLKWKALIPVGEKTIEETGMDILEIQDGLITRNEVYFDQIDTLSAMKANR